MLKGKEIVLGVAGGIAVYKAVELLRLLVKAGANVHVVMTKSATEFVTPLTFQTLSRNPVHLELFNLISEEKIGHIALADRADLYIIAPATANVIGKIAHGIADDLLTTTVMATRAPVLIAPAMNVNMYRNPIYRENEARLKEHGYLFVAPACGMLACGYEGEGKLQAPEVIFEEAVAALTPKRLAGERILVTAGPTLEEIDPVRYISNHSSGKMGYAIARQARLRGAAVTLVTGPTCLAPPVGVEVIRVQSAQEMRDAVQGCLSRIDIVIKAAAVADYRPRTRAGEKMKKSQESLCIELEKNPDILAELGAGKGERILVGFAAETQDLLRHAGAKLKAKNLDLVVANDVSQEGAGFNVDTNIAKLLFSDGRVEELPMMEKEDLAGVILENVETLLGEKRAAKG
ncbi:bifunctional phosphopantothenoylcysteine decarboxylase/phosphopantothenate--cysteine ligase CoaBC [Geomonas sp. Red69]|uniref:Coenzyme A biosynthesis bifunctional protein CoaBC n=1 Tax=Geomonas diazotrophica TaxID=2843197 RepID=A0ABX8JDQ7_9BACT|nr:MULTISPECIES: bifunctional phosphopantothenoylcysteine decarboxylase/phosphopantothenate--cysteine ligase CoaBC [Geomonas]MBU5638189.1 bifunctional phosphopantothenoylcysteine decarboxylase/phosphopantothenate--cysteine ligase CoaBC [Geomonas diazotrophica]QWV95908.1 bifunctional phosphopantothenoylcysteine decarboxylase/phosphopantothenate--cysteine ligase CoaBC [Geomonas nitrogeniifigens]QXE84994.1 bifunctional phosphopantothenoylcysteine decarboxylase/phosphopantothenate--cysteine ligase C